MTAPLAHAPRKTLIFPMEIIERELNGNLLLAHEAMARGWQVIFGTKRTILDSAAHLPPGIVFLKSIMSCDLENMRTFKRAGHKLVCLDVEGLVYTSPEEFVTVRFCEETLQEIERAFFWGNCQLAAIQKAYPHFAERFAVTGTPIVDLWRPQFHAFYADQLAALRQKYGRYIILPSAFASVNHFMGEKGNSGILVRDAVIAEKDQKEFFKFWNDYERHVYFVFEKFLALLPQISRAFPNHKIIVRPHPSESHARWQAIAKNLPNVVVVFEGSVSPWLLAADAMLHWGCTTGVESYLMKRPVVAYKPHSPPGEAAYDHKVPHCISIMAHTPEDVIEKLQQAVATPDKIQTLYPELQLGESYLREWILYSDTETAAAKVMREIETINLQATTFRNQPHQVVPMKEYVWRTLEGINAFVNIADKLPSRLKLGIESRAYGRHKTRTISASELEDGLSTLSRLQHGIPTHVEEIYPNLFCLTPDTKRAEAAA